MMLITNMVELCQNYRSIDQKTIDRLSILSFSVRLWQKLAYGGFDDAHHEYTGVLPELSIDLGS